MHANLKDLVFQLLVDNINNIYILQDDRYIAWQFKENKNKEISTLLVARLLQVRLVEKGQINFPIIDECLRNGDLHRFNSDAGHLKSVIINV